MTLAQLGSRGDRSYDVRHHTNCGNDKIEELRIEGSLDFIGRCRQRCHSTVVPIVLSFILAGVLMPVAVPVTLLSDAVPVGLLSGTVPVALLNGAVSVSLACMFMPVALLCSAASVFVAGLIVPVFISCCHAGQCRIGFPDRPDHACLRFCHIFLAYLRLLRADAYVRTTMCSRERYSKRTRCGALGQA